ncbi:uncharacterized protein LOC127724345 [Mytilus californianus]|uniref:uncharacterized protein LOC127724345 n=1 Tax=Mytilus californianus TaxID=6549 RepID=UPI002247E7E5|nr:uncharacterized protein LOC127724345 [Mytilus californianus]XP_052087244.1 uncharacterized protein LOC127724345 [Mytilus californianus]
MNLQEDFHTTLVKVGDQLDADDLEKLKFLVIEKDVNRAELDRAKSGCQCFDLLEKNGIIDQNNTEQLQEWLKTLQNAKALQILQNFYPKEERSSIKNQASSNVSSSKIVTHFKSTRKLAELKEAIGSTCINFVTLKGLLGSGKSQMALKYACEFKENNATSIVWKLHCKDLTSLQTSLKHFCTGLDLKVEMDESKQTTDSIEDLGQKILQILKARKEAIHVLILDDVMLDSCRFLQRFIRECRSCQHIKIIVTTFQPLFNDCKIIEINGFTEDEAVNFLSEGRKLSKNDIEEYTKLGSKYSFLPLGLYCARTYIHRTHISPKKFNKLCENTALRQIEDSHCIEDDPESVLDNKTLFKALIQFIDILKNTENPKVFEMILSLQFLEIEDIPVLLFDYFVSDSPDTNHAVETNNFIQALQKFSFGKIEGEDDDRVLSTHYAVVTSLKIFCEQQKSNVGHMKLQTRERNLLKQLLRAFMYVMDKDNRSKIDFKRNKMMVQHARSALIHADELFKKDQSLRHDLEFLMSVIYVHDLVGYTYNFDGILNVAAHHSDMAKSYCFVLLNVEQVAFENDLKDQCRRVESIDQLDRFCKEKAKHLFDEMKSVASGNADKFINFAKYYILEKYRAEDDISALSKILENDLERETRLNESEFETLRHKGYAVPLEDMTRLFLYELLLSTFYTHGRRIFYLITPVDVIKARTFCSYLYISYHLAQMITNKFQQWECLYAMLTERSGTLQQCIDDHSDLKQHNMIAFQKVASRCEAMLQEDRRYFMFGIFKTDTRTDDHCQAIWLKQLIRCYKHMLRFAQNETEKKEVITKGKECVARLQESLPSMEDRTCFQSLLFSVGEFCECIEDYTEAEKILETLCPNLTGQELIKEKLNKYEKKASILFIKCICKSNEIDRAKQLYDRFTRNLQNTKDTFELQSLEEINKKYSLSQS